MRTSTASPQADHPAVRADVHAERDVVRVDAERDVVRVAPIGHGQPTPRIQTTSLDLARRRADEKLFERYHRSHERRHRDELVLRFMPLAHKLARRYSQNPQMFDDLTQVAAIGLINAVDRFDPSRGLAFSSFAVPTIVGELKRYFRDRGWAVRPPRGLQERVLRVEGVIKQFTSDHNRAPTVPELAERLDDLTEEDVLDALHARRAAHAVSLDQPTTHSEDDATLADQLGSVDSGYALAERRVLLESLQRHLSPRDRAILQMRFVEDMTQAEIGAIVGVSQMQISRLVRQSIQQMSILAGTQ